MKSELENIKMGMTWTTYIGAAYGVLKAADLWDGEVWQLMGMSGMAFHFIVHEEACPSSVTVYDWNMTHFHAMDRVGIYSDSICITNQPGLNTYEKLKAAAICKIRQSLDSGRGVVVWAPTPILEFGIIRGYDDTEKIFQVVDCINENPDPLLYDNLGRGEVPMLYIQCMQEAVSVDQEKVFRDSLATGVRMWQQPHFNPHYANGGAAYDNLAAALETGKYNEFGLTYITTVYADSKKCLARYLEHIAGTSRYLGQLQKEAALYGKIAEYFDTMLQIAPFRGPGQAAVDKTRIPEMTDLLKQCKVLEEQAVNGIAAALSDSK